jgi:hypothetical protein
VKVSLVGGNFVKAVFYRDLETMRRYEPDTHDALGLMVGHPDAPHVATIHLPLPCSAQVIIHEAVHAAIHNARFRNLRGDEREEWICMDAGHIGSRILTAWNQRRRKSQ